MKNKIAQQIIEEQAMAIKAEAAPDDSLNIIQATAMAIVTIIAVTLGTIYGSIL